MDAIVVGIDVAKDQLDVAVRPSGESFVVARNGAGIGELASKLAAMTPHVIALEATGGFEVVVAAGLAAANLPIVVVNPAQVRAFAQALGKRAKTDPIDAAVIAHFAEATKVRPRALPDEMTRLLADLVSRRRQIVEMMAAEGQRERSLTDKRLRKSIARLRKAMEKELAELDGEIDDQVRGSPVWAEKEDLLASVPGIGPIIARTLIAAKSQPSPASPLGPANPANGAARASSAADEKASAVLSSSPPWWQAVTTQPSNCSATGSLPPANQSSSP
jgi:transposase